MDSESHRFQSLDRSFVYCTVQQSMILIRIEILPQSLTYLPYYEPTTCAIRRQARLKELYSFPATSQCRLGYGAVVVSGIIRCAEGGVCSYSRVRKVPSFNK